MALYQRYITHSVLEVLIDTPVVLINGPRQTGKSTFCKQLTDTKAVTAEMVTLDDATVRAAAMADPGGFLESFSGKLIIDEVQRVPELFLAIKKIVDENRHDSRFLLTSSVDVLALPKIGDSLAGRIETINLWPLSQTEILGTKSEFLTTLVNPTGSFSKDNVLWKDIIMAICSGGFPEALERRNEQRRAKWFESYINSVLQKDIRDLSNIEGLSSIPQVLNLIATRISSTINLSEIARISGIRNTTFQRYMALLEHVFMILKIPAWTPNAEGQFVKSPKIFLNDTGLLCHLRDEDMDSLERNRPAAGAFLENFVVLEIIKQLSWSTLYLKPYHFSTHSGAEVDIVLEDRKKNIYGIEIKSRSSIDRKDFKGLHRLSELAGNKFRKGIVLYTGVQALKGFGDKMEAVPVTAVWS